MTQETAEQKHILPKLTVQQAGILVAISLAAAMTTFHGRLLSSSLSDLCGIWGLSSEEGAILNTLTSIPQLLLATTMPFFMSTLGIRIFLLPISAGFIVITFFIPFIHGFTNLIIAHFISGLILGCFVTSTIQIMMKYIPPKWWIVTLAFFTFRVSLGINTGVSLGGFYVEHIGWQWIYWQSTLVMTIYFILIYKFLPGDTPRLEMLRHLDASGMVFFCLGCMLFFAGMDLGERFGWFDSRLIVVCLCGSGLFFLLFVVNEYTVRNPWASPRLFASFNIVMSVGMVAIYIFIMTANSLLITHFLSTVQELKPIQSGNALLVIALLQVLLTPFCVYLVLKVDTRLTCAAGIILMALACYQGTRITADWVAADFFPMGILFACGHPLVFLSLMAFCIASFTMQTAPGLLAYIQFLRISTPAAGGAALLLIVRQREDLHLTSLGSRLTGDTPAVRHFLETGGSLEDLHTAATTQATVLAINDVFGLCCAIALGTLALLVFIKAMKPTPVSPVPVGGTLPDPAVSR